MKHSILNSALSRWLAIASVGLAAAGAAQQAAADTRIGYVNMDRIIHDAAPAVRAQKQLQQEFQPREQELQRLAKQGQDLQARLEKDKLTASQAAQQAEERQLAQLSRDFQVKQSKFASDLNARRNQEMSQFQDRVRRTIQTIAQRDKLEMVLYDGVAYASPTIDLTDRVLKGLAEK